MTPNELRALASTIKNATENSENTAKRVGGLLNDIVDYLDTLQESVVTEDDLLNAITSLKEEVLLDAINKYLSKVNIDTAAERITFDKGAVVRDLATKNYVKGTAGAGIYNEGVDSVLEIDKLFVRKEAFFNELIINQIRFQGGVVVYSAANLEVLSVTDGGDYLEVYFDTKNGQIANQFAIDDQIKCQRFFNGNTLKYYMSRVTSIGEDYIHISKSDIDGTLNVGVGDQIVQFGNRTNTSRQSLIEVNVLDGGKQTFYQNVNSYSLVDKNQLELGRMLDGGEWRNMIRAFGGYYFGNRDLSSYVKFNEATQQVEVNADLKFLSGGEYIGVGTGIGNALNDAKTYTNNRENFLQNQIDGVIDSFFVQYAPVPRMSEGVLISTPVNYPASEWADNVEKERHLGDTLTNMEAYIDDATTPDSGMSWRWIEGTVGSGNYYWMKIADADISKALVLAGKAQDTADGKRRVFTAEPNLYQAYDEGDLWVNATYTQAVAPYMVYTNDLLRCKQYKLIGDAFSINHWELASKYTDDTLANLALLNVANITVTVNEIVSNNIIIPSEKIDLKRDFDEITQDKIALIQQAYYQRVDDYYPDEIDAVDTLYSELADMLSVVFYNMNTNTSLDADLTLSIAEFQLFFSNYFEARSTLIECAAIVNMEILDDFANAFNDINDVFYDMKLSRVNLSLHKNIDMYAADTGHPADDSKFTVLQGGYDIETPDKAYLKNDSAYQLTVGKATKTEGAATQYSVVMYDFTTNTSFFDKKFAFSNYPRIVGFATPSSGKWSLLIYAGVSGATKFNRVEYRDILLQKANNEIAISETYKYLTDALANDTEISGGIIATNLVLMKNETNQITAGVSGMSDGVGFWAGGTYAGALAGLANAIIYKNGLAKFKNAEIAGRIVSKNGEIGGLKIAGNSLASQSMEFGESLVETVAQLITPITATITEIGGWSDSNVDDIAHANTYSLTITVTSEIKFKVSASTDGVTSLMWAIYIKSTNGSEMFRTEGTGTLSNNTFSAIMPAGIYIIHAECFAELSPDDLTEFSVTINGYETANTIKAIGFSQKTKVGNNGLFSFWGDNNYLHYSAASGLEVKGAVNLSGVLAAGNVSGTSHTNRWGAKASSSSVGNSTTGEYLIPHTIGHTNYTVQVTINEKMARFPVITSKYNNSVLISIVDTTGALKSCNFEYCIIGNNYY